MGLEEFTASPLPNGLWRRAREAQRPLAACIVLGFLPEAAGPAVEGSTGGRRRTPGLPCNTQAGFVDFRQVSAFPPEERGWVDTEEEDG